MSALWKIAIAALLLGAALPARGAQWSLAGEVVDLDGAPVIGANVAVWIDSTPVAAGAADEHGRFALRLKDSTAAPLRLVVSSVGYLRHESTVAGGGLPGRLRIELRPAPVAVEGVTVQPPEAAGAPCRALTRAEVAAAAQTSFVPGNPIDAVKEPRVLREGSSHSARLRVSGSSPVYTINGIAIGRNPTHYGMFAVVPAAVVERMTVRTLGTGAAHDAPAAIDLALPRPYGRHRDASLSLSAIDATAAWSLGGPHWFTLGAARKSVLDEIVNRLDTDAGRRTVPPTNFQDLVASSGLRLGSAASLAIDQYHVHDALEYRTGGTARNTRGAQTALATAEHYIGARLEMLRSGTLLRLQAAVQSTEESYAAASVPDGDEAEPPILDLHASGVTTTIAGEVVLSLGACELTIGDRVRHVMKQRIDLTQQNWNFLPPDAASDLPNPYQPELNRLYGSYHGTRRRTDHAAYASLRWRAGPVHMESGARIGHFGGLARKEWAVFRQAATLDLDDKGALTFFAGTFAEDPAQRVLEAYQALVHTDYNGLQPVRTALVSLQYTCGPASAALYRKQIAGLPVLTPDFRRVAEDGAAGEGFLRTRSIGEADFAGGDITLAFDSLAGGRLALTASYGYTAGTKTTASVTAPSEFNAPHRWYAMARYRVSRVVAVGAEAAVRSGYAYTLPPKSPAAPDGDRLTVDYYRAALARENGARFPTHATLNLNAVFDFGAAEAYCAIANITNRANPIIRSADGFIYDAGILPSAGVTVRF